MFYSSGTTGRPKGILFPLPDRSIRDEHPLYVQYASPITNRADDVYLSPRRCTTRHRSSSRRWSTAWAAR